MELTQEKILESQIWEFQFTYLEILTLCSLCNFEFGIMRRSGYCISRLGFEFKLKLDMPWENQNHNVENLYNKLKAKTTN